MMTYFPGIDGFNIHDDWGSQKETFFSPAVAEEMLVPYMRRLIDFLHSKGKFCDFHCCGQNLKQVPNMIKTGWDSWSGQPMNDTAKIYELYGDQILIGVYPELAPDASEEEQRKAAKVYAEKFCNPNKPSLLAGGFFLPQPFREELYKQSRICYAK
jgi:uroporphyrinogen-III decarboxylase